MISYKDVLRAWDRFFFAPRPTEGMAVFRIVWVSLILLWFLSSLYNVHIFYGPHAIFSLKTVKGEFPLWHMNMFHLLSNTYESTYFIFFAFGISILTSLVGFYTRTSLIVLLACMVSVHQRNIWVLSSAETLMRIITMFLVCSPCGHSLSIDSLLGRKYPHFRREKTWAPWAWRLIQIQVSVVYLWTVWQKFAGPDWLDGTALYYATRMEEFYNFSVPYVLDSIPFLKALTWATLGIEVALGLLVWVKEWRKTVIWTGIIFHLGIEYVMCIPFFEWTMVVLLLAFYTPEEYQDLIYRVREKMREVVVSSDILPSVKEKMVWALR